MPPAIFAENLSKAYRIGLKEEIPDTFLQAATGWMRKPFSNLRRLRRLNTFGNNGNGHDEEDIVWALNDVSFEVEEGEVVGIIGRNGAGKSTLLKVLSRITEPTAGCARIRGRVSSLLEVGTGFHPELSGRENIYMNGTILGMTKREIDRKFDEIVDFSGVEKFLDTPIKRYSSGMQVRLAFSVAAHLEPEILIIDEVLAVGDAEFQKRCLGKMQDVAGSGRTVLFVSHNMAAVSNLCTSAMLIKNGKLDQWGDVSDIIERYLTASAPSSCSDIDLNHHPGRSTRREPVLQRLRILDSNGNVASSIPLGGTGIFEVSLNSEELFDNVNLIVAVMGPHGEKLCNLHTRFQYDRAIRIQGAHVFLARLDNCRLAPTTYRIQLTLKSDWRVIDEITEGLKFEVSPHDVYGTNRLPKLKHGMIVPEVSWMIEPNRGHVVDTAVSEAR